MIMIIRIYSHVLSLALLKPQLSHNGITVALCQLLWFPSQPSAILESAQTLLSLSVENVFAFNIVQYKFV